MERAPSGQKPGTGADRHERERQRGGSEKAAAHLGAVSVVIPVLAQGEGRRAPGIGAGMDPRLAPPGKPIHEAVGGALGGRRLGLSERVRAGNADRAESQGFGPALDGLRKVHLGLA